MSNQSFPGKNELSLFLFFCQILVTPAVYLLKNYNFRKKNKRDIQVVVFGLAFGVTNLNQRPTSQNPG